MAIYEYLIVRINEARKTRIRSLISVLCRLSCSKARYSILLDIRTARARTVIRKIPSSGIWFQVLRLTSTDAEMNPAAIGIGNPINEVLFFLSFLRRVNLISL